MKLAEALILRADTQNRLGQLKQRLIDNARVQEGDEPVEAPGRLMAQVDDLCDAYQRLIQQINATNIQTTFEPGISLTDALARRDVLAMKRRIYHDLIKAATIRQERYTHTEVRYQSTVVVSELQQVFDDLARDYRELDIKIQELNWKTDLNE